MSAPVPQSVLRKKLRLRRIRLEKHLKTLGSTRIGIKIYTPYDMLNNWQRHVIAKLKGKDSVETKKLKEQRMGAYLAACEHEVRNGQT